MCAIERSNPKAGVGQILKLYLEYFYLCLEYFSSYVHVSKLNDKVRIDPDLHKGSNLRMMV